MTARAAAALLALLAAGRSAAEGPTASVVLRWQPVPGGASYDLQVARDPRFANVVASARVAVPGYRWQRIPAERHYWRVRSLDDQGRAGPWSEVRVIDAALVAPEPLSPPDGARFVLGEGPREVAFEARPSELLREYAVEISTAPEFASVVASHRGAASSARVRLPGPGAFYWRLTGTSLTGEATPPSDPRSFTVALAPPSPVGPAPLPDGLAVRRADGAPWTLAPSPPLVPGRLSAEPAPLPEGHFRPSGFPVGFGLLAGWHTNLARASTALVTLEATWRPGLLEGRLGLSARAGWYGTSSTIPVGPGVPQPIEASATVFPLSVLASYHLSVAGLPAYVGAGPSLQLVRASVGPEADLSAAAGALVVAGLERPFGPGALALEAGILLGGLDTSLARMRTGGLQLAVGYRLRP